jgi:CheY-like chemotaxis protein
LSQQLLTFSRRQIVQPEVLDPNEVVRSLAPLLKRLIGEHIELQILPGDFVARVLVDRVQLGQVLINLAANARDAMPEGGILTIATSLVFVVERQASDVRFTVQDTGSGIEEGHLHRIFDPFFTTKEVGQGTGLGLATVYGIVEQAGGFVTVESPPGSGATFYVHLPAYEATPVDPPKSEKALAPALAPRVILIAEDEPQILEICRRFLENAGYQILATVNGTDALARSRSFAGAIDLLLTDMIMPGLGGRELARTLRAERPSMQVIFMTGYPPDISTRSEMEDECILQKPLSREVLLTAVANAFASSSDS